MEATFHRELVAPTIAGLEPEQLQKLVDQGKFGDYLEERIYSSSEPETEMVDSEAAADHAAAAGDEEWAATLVLRELNEEDQEKAATQAYVSCGQEVWREVMDLA